MTKAEAFHNQHVYRQAGLRIGDGFVVVAMEYGAFRSVYAADACNYSYREFWF